jgi:hypothetical protein
MKRTLILTGVLGLPLHITTIDANAAGKFYCGSYEGAPATMTNSSRTGKAIPIIMWKSNYFSGDGFSPERRCQEVSSRFNNLHASGRLKMLTTGRLNGMPVICASVEKGSGCVEGGLLYTLKAGQNAGETLRNLLAVRTKATGPLTETTQRPYISIEEIEQVQESNTGAVVGTEGQGVIRESKVKTSEAANKPLNVAGNNDSLW